MSKATNGANFYICVLSVTAVSSNGFAEDIPNSTVLPLAKVVSNIYLQGYSGTNKVEYDDDVYKAIVLIKMVKSSICILILLQQQYLYQNKVLKRLI